MRDCDQAQLMKMVKSNLEVGAVSKILVLLGIRRCFRKQGASRQACVTEAALDVKECVPSTKVLFRELEGGEWY